MKKLNMVLAVSALALFLLSFLTWRESVTRAQRFERGQKLLPNLNPDEIAEITLTQGDAKTVLRRSKERGEERFVVASAQGYPAKNEAVNRLIRDALGVELEKEVGRGEDLEKELGLVGADETIGLTFKGSDGQTMVDLRIGKGMEGQGGSAAGNYAKRFDRSEDPIYLTSSRVYLSTGEEDFLQDVILDVKPDQIAHVRGNDYELVASGDDLELQGVPAGKKADSSKLNQLRSLLSYLRFDKNHLADAPEVQGLAFGPPIELELKDRSGYQVRVAEQGGKHYLQIQGFMAVNRVAVGLDDSDEKNQENADILQRADDIQAFNDLHGSWIYEVSASVAEKVGLRKAGLLE